MIPQEVLKKSERFIFSEFCVYSKCKNLKKNTERNYVQQIVRSVNSR